MSSTEPRRAPFPAAQAILAVPTAFELERLRHVAPALLEPGRFEAVTLTGFGPVAAAASVAAIGRGQPPAGVIQLGIAGTYDPRRVAVGSSVMLGRLALDGVGAGRGADFQLPSQMGFPQLTLDTGEAVFETLELPGEGPLGLTVCAAASDSAMVADRLRRFPDAVLEDMESFGAALGCRAAGVPFAALRGISNEAGDRDRERWKVDEALAAAADQLTRLFFPR